MNVQNGNFQETYKKYIENEKAQQAKLAKASSTVTNPEIRKYLETSQKVMNQFNQLDEFVLSTTSQKPKGFLEKIKSFFKR